MCTGFDSAADAVRAAADALDYLNGTDATALDGGACGEVLVALGNVQGKLTAAHAGWLRRSTPPMLMTRTGTVPPPPGWRRGLA